MQYITDNTQFKINKTAVALGFFDGVHLGHRRVISSVVNMESKGYTPLVYTFSKSPKSILNNSNAEYLTDNKRKAELLDSLGVKYLCEADFTSIKNLSPDKFVYDILYKSLNAGVVSCGFNYHFGINGTGDADTLIYECNKYNIRVNIIEPVILNNTVISSSRIKQEIKLGNISLANEMLGDEFTYTSIIQAGRQLGRRLGTPTINQNLDNNIVVPKFGVYASQVQIDDTYYRAVTNIGTKPTVNYNKVISESWLIDGDFGDLYGKTSTVRLVDFIRPEVKFNSIDELRTAILTDGKKVKSMDIYTNIKI